MTNRSQPNKLRVDSSALFFTILSSIIIGGDNMKYFKYFIPFLSGFGITAISIKLLGHKKGSIVGIPLSTLVGYIEGRTIL